MARLWPILAAALAILPLGARASEAAPAALAQTSQQVLVMLRLSPEHQRTGASYAGGYGGGASRAARQRIASRIAREHGLTVETGWPMPSLGVDCFVMRLPPGRQPEEVAAILSKERQVAWSQPMQTYRALSMAAPNDPLYRAQPAAQSWRLSDLHRVSTGKNVRVAVVDSAVDPAHPDLAGQTPWRQDFVTGRPAAAELHGTAVAGVIAARADNAQGIVGVAPEARLMALRACWQEAGAGGTVCDTLSIARALQFAVDHRAQVINMSLAGPPDQLLGRLLDVASQRGAVVVGAADPKLPGGGFPASHAGVLAVGGEPGADAPFLAPGRDVPAPQPGGRWGLVSGSSYSAAHVTGLVALIRERRSAERPRLVRTAGGEIDACASVPGACLPAPARSSSR